VYTKQLLLAAKFQLKLNVARSAVYTEHRILQLKDATNIWQPILSTYSLLARGCSLCHLVLPQLCGGVGLYSAKTVDSLSVIGKVPYSCMVSCL